MYKSQAFLILSIPLALLSIFSFLYGVVYQTSKLSIKAERTKFETTHQPWFQPQTDKVIFIVIDALRFDFFINQGQDPELPEDWKHHQFRKFMGALWKNPSNSVIIKAHVDAPTLTTARVPSMMTGNFPRKASNFHHNTIFPIAEDNILYQMKKAGRKIYYGGDPIWPVYFPNEFEDSISERDYDIKTVDVDNEVYDFIWDVFKNKQYDLLIGHFLGLDHMAHGAGFTHPSTIHAKNKIEQFLLKIMEEMDDQTTLLVLGDHGAELNGEHGKDSLGESYVPIVGYNKKGFYKNYHSSFAKAMKYLRNGDVVKQVDLTPTLAMLMGVPVPFSNAGQVLNDFYPAREFPVNEICSNRNFELQLLYNNYANSLQIMKYLEEKQTQTNIFDEKYFKELQDLSQQLNGNFTELKSMVNDTKKCQDIHQPILDTITQAQDFSNKAYDLIKNTNPYDFSMALSGITGLALLLISYVLVSQILQVEGYRRKSHFKFNSLLNKRAQIRFTFLVLLVAISLILTKKISSAISVCSLILNLLFCGSLFISFVKLRKSKAKLPSQIPSSKEGPQAVDNSPYSEKGLAATGSFNQNSEPETPQTPMNDDEAFKIMPESKFAAFLERAKGLYNSSPLKRLFSSPQIYAFSAVAIVASTLYLTFTNDLSEVRRAYFIKYTPIVSFMMIGFLAAFNIQRFFRYIVALTLVICSIIYFGNLDIYSWRRSVPLGIFMLSEWFFNEIYLMLTKLKTTKIMALLQFSSVCALFVYLLDKENSESMYKLILPRIIWGLMLGNIVAGKIQKISSHATKRNLQFCLVILLLMLRLKKQILAFAVLLQLMNLTNKMFQRVDVKNTLYPTILAFWGYMGIYIIYMTERYVPFSYVPASLGKTDYDYVFSPLFFMIYLLCTCILASLFMSYYNQQLEFDAQAQDTSLPQTKSVTGNQEQSQIDEKTAVIIKRRNVFPFVIFYSVLIVSVSIETLSLCVKNEPFTFERFLLNSGFYLYVLVSGIFLIK